MDVTDSDVSPMTVVSGLASAAYEHRETLQMYAHLIAAALFPIYVGAHASMRRPPSAAKPIKTNKDEESKDERPVEGLQPSDAILFPVLAGLTLAGLYFLIKWLKDPAIINRILGWYFSILGVFGVGKLAGDTLNVITTVVFPSAWAADGQVYLVDQLLSVQAIASRGVAGRPPLQPKIVAEKKNPLPGPLSTLQFSESTNKKLWVLRGLFTDHWIFKAYMHGVGKGTAQVRLNDLLGFLIGLAAIILYNTTGKAWWLTNLMGFGFSYEALQLMSPTNFSTGSMVLAGLFIYDITMVFYTPLMVTVATSLDVPIKLVFPGPSGGKPGGMLGLGDVVLPGIMIALALRFDLYLFYLQKQRQVSAFVNGAFTKKLERVPFVETKGTWGPRLWTRGIPAAQRPDDATAGIFPKVYFHAALVGYVVGMICTVVVLNYFNHAQPALLYLVPGVLTALWGTAAARGELPLMWSYTEDGSLELPDEAIKPPSQKNEAVAAEQSRDVFHFSLSRPSRGLRIAKPSDKTA